MCIKCWCDFHFGGLLMFPVKTSSVRYRLWSVFLVAYFLTWYMHFYFFFTKKRNRVYVDWFYERLKILYQEFKPRPYKLSHQKMCSRSNIPLSQTWEVCILISRSVQVCYLCLLNLKKNLSISENFFWV